MVAALSLASLHIIMMRILWLEATPVTASRRPWPLILALDQKDSLLQTPPPSTHFNQASAIPSPLCSIIQYIMRIAHTPSIQNQIEHVMHQFPEISELGGVGRSYLSILALHLHLAGKFTKRVAWIKEQIIYNMSYRTVHLPRTRE